jgi:hypothetical protein
LLQTQTFFAVDVAAVGSNVPKEKSVSPLICTFAGTVPLMETVPVEVDPSDPWVAAWALVLATKAMSAPATSARR